MEGLTQEKSHELQQFFEQALKDARKFRKMENLMENGGAHHEIEYMKSVIINA